MRCFAHRGGSLEAPEGTLRAFRRAVALGCDGVELDVRATADGEVVVAHDPELDRTTDGSGPIGAATLSELRSRDAAHWFVPGRGPDPGAEEHPMRGSAADDLRIPTLAEVLAALPGVPLVIDLKVGPPELPDFPAAVAELLRREGRMDDVIVGSFGQERLDAFRAVAPGVPTSATPEEVAALWQDGTPTEVPGFCAYQVPVAYGDVDVVTPAFVQRAHAVGAEVHVWTVDEPSEMLRLRDLGVDAIITDRPAVAMAALGRQAAEGRPGGA